jgi:uncharacterized membrane protein
VDLKSIASSAILTAICLTVAAGATAGPAAKPAFAAEKCYGVVKAGKNDCQTATHACAGTSTQDSQKDAWVYTPKGTCERIVGGSTQPKG